MTFKYLLDTNIVADMVKNPQGKIARALAQVGSDQVCTSIIVTAELRFGVMKVASPAFSKI